MSSAQSKDVRSTTLERLRRTRHADLLVAGLPQPLQLGEGLYHLLDHIDLPLETGDLIAGRIREEVPDPAGETFFQDTLSVWNGRAIPPWMKDGGHECLAWELLLELGLSGLEKRARAQLRRRRAAGEPVEILDFLRGAVRVYQAFRNYARRYARQARRRNMEELAARCAAVAEGPPATFAEALQLIWFVGHVYCTMLAQNPTLTFGRMDLLLHGFYRRDLDHGRLTPGRAGALIDDFYRRNDLILGRGEHQMSNDCAKATGWQRNLTYDAPQYVVLGGRSPAGVEDFGDLTRLFLERVDPGYENPVIVFRYHPGLPEDIWHLACDRMRANASMMVYNDECVIPAMIHAGIRAEDAVTYTMHGCNWPDIPGIQRAVGYHQAVLPRYFLEALDAFGDGEIPSIDVLYDQFALRFRAEITERCAALRRASQEWDEQAPGVLRVDDCFLDGPVDRARSAGLGGTRYSTLTCAITSVATAADCFAAVDELVLRRRQVALPRLRRALETDFQADEPLRRLLLDAPKFGRDDARADAHAVRVLDRVIAEIDHAAYPEGEDPVIVFRCLETDMRHIGIGARIGATPDGRRAGQPISENTSPFPGSADQGLTAMLTSVARLPLDRINSGALNIRLQPRLVAGDRGLGILVSLLRTYFDLGGLQAQLSLADTETLRQAQRCPREHCDLMVRITGYSAVFVDMAQAAQEEIIRREEMSAP